MIQYSLKCENDHSFDSWFASADAYDKLADNGMVSCAVCGSTKVSKAIMAPRVRTTKGKEAPAAPTLPTEKFAAEQAMAEMRARISAMACSAANFSVGNVGAAGASFPLVVRTRGAMIALLTLVEPQTAQDTMPLSANLS